MLTANINATLFYIFSNRTLFSPKMVDLFIHTQEQTLMIECSFLKRKAQEKKCNAIFLLFINVSFYRTNKHKLGL